MSEYNIRRWNAGRLAQVREAVEEGCMTYADAVEAINAGEYAITEEG